MVSGRVLHHQALIALDALVLEGLLHSPFADEGPFLFVVLLVGPSDVLLSVGSLPSLVPVVGELLEEVRLDSSGLRKKRELVSSKALSRNQQLADRYHHPP